MKNFDWDSFTLCLLVVVPLTLLGGIIVLDNWSSQQIRVMYQTAYQKNLDCRSSVKSSTASFITNVCGPIPKWEHFGFFDHCSPAGLGSASYFGRITVTVAGQGIATARPSRL